MDVNRVLLLATDARQPSVKGGAHSSSKGLATTWNLKGLLMVNIGAYSLPQAWQAWAAGLWEEQIHKAKLPLYT